MTLIAKSKQNTEAAMRKGKKAFSFTTRGTVYGNKHGNLVNDIVRTTKQTICTLRNPDKKLEFVKIKLFVHDSSTIFNYSEHSKLFESITAKIQEFVGAQVKLDIGVAHKQDDELKVCVEGEICEKDMWK